MAKTRVVLLAALILLLGAILWRNDEARRASAIPQTAPQPLRALSVELSPAHEFTLVGMDGRPIRLAAWRGRSPLVLSFFSSDCHACRAELPQLIRLYDAHRGQGLKVALVSIEPAAQIRKYASSQRLPFPVMLDPHQELYRTYGVGGTPFTLLIGPDGRVVGRPANASTETQFEAEFVPQVDAAFEGSASAGA